MRAILTAMVLANASSVLLFFGRCYVGRVISTATGQGWGITTDGESLIVSDGSAMLYFWDPETMEETRKIEVIRAEWTLLPHWVHEVGSLD